jgi:enoyl-[acyl-carrier-protein] reductase (NADH)
MDLKLAGKTALALDRTGSAAEEIGAAIAFIASEHSGYTSGSVLTIDAGLFARAQAFE